MIISLASGLFGAILVFLLNLWVKDKDEKKILENLRNAIYYEIYIINENFKHVTIELKASRKKLDFYPEQLVFCIETPIFDNAQVLSNILRLEKKEVVSIFDYYMFFKALEKKLEQHAKHIQEYDDKFKNDRGLHVLKSSSLGIDHDMNELSKAYDVLNNLNEFTKIIGKLTSPL